MLRAAAVAGRHRGDGDAAAGLAEQDQGAGTLEFHIIRVGMQGEDPERFGHGFPPIGGDANRTHPHPGEWPRFAGTPAAVFSHPRGRVKAEF